MEDKMAWRRVHGELVENHRLAQDMNATLAESRACRSKLLSRLTAEEEKNGGGAGGEGGRGYARWTAMLLRSVLQFKNPKLFSSCSQPKRGWQIRVFQSW